MYIDFKSLQLIVYGEDRSKVGIHTITIKGALESNLDESGEFQFELEALDPCLSSRLKISNPGELIYTVGEGNMIIPFDVEVVG